jgi:non-specific serine/threonine protein kinase
MTRHSILLSEAMADVLSKLSCLRLTPGGKIHPIPGSEQSLSPAARDVARAFGEGEGAGLFASATSAAGDLPPDLAFWRELASRYLVERCHTPMGTQDLEPLEATAEYLALAEAAPPMEGAEYLDKACLAGLWKALDDWLIREARVAGGLERLLAERASAWHQVGRVCFHLAENKKDREYPFAFLATYAPSLAGAGRIRYQPLARALEEYAGKGDRGALRRLLEPVQRAAEKSELVRELVESRDLYQPLAWTAAEAYGFLREAPLLEESGVLVRLPDWWAARPRPKVKVRIGSRAEGLLGGGALLDFDLGLALGGERLTREEIAGLLAGSSGLRFLRGRWVEVDPERLAQALDQWKKVEKRVGDEGISFAEGMRLLAGAPADLSAPQDPELQAWSCVDAGERLGAILASLRSPESLESLRLGDEFRTRLRPYQETGLAWLRFLTGLGLGACLADDMGLGKTIQVIALLLALRKEGRRAGKRGAGAYLPSLIVMPASLLANWSEEIGRFAPSLKVRFVHPSMEDGAKLEPGAESGADGPDSLGGCDLVATSYGMLARRKWLGEREWNLVILDEAQAIKNPGSAQAREVKRLRCRARIALTGTPVENRLGDLWSLFDFLCPGLLGSAARFKSFVARLEKGEGRNYAPLRALVSPYILRRLKTDKTVIADLPQKTELRAYCGLSKVQAALYADVVESLRVELRESGGMERRGLVLSALMKLKQICNHPAHFAGDGRWEASASGKFARLAELCEEIASRQERVLVFTQFREMTEPLAAFLAGLFGRGGLVLHGGTPVKERQKLVAEFQEDDGPPFFVLSLKAGGTGLNLTAASQVVHFDRWWNPAVENQATDRAFRIGQRRNVLVHKFVCRGTVEERIDELMREKSELAEDILGGAELSLTELPDDRLLETLSLDLERARSGT